MMDGYSRKRLPGWSMSTWWYMQATFALAAASTWALPLLDLLLRVQINVLGRHLYFASLQSLALA
jgi:hypothetical protein